MFASIVFDLLLTAILAAGIVIGIKKGFISTVARPVKVLASIAIAIALASAIGSAIISPIIGPAISNKISGVLIEKYSDITAENAMETLPTLIKFAASMCGIDVTKVASTADGVLIIEEIVDSVTSPIVSLVSAIAGFIIVYIVAKILLGILLRLIESMFESGIAATTNKVLGAVFTFLLAFAAAWAFTAVSEFLLNIPLIAKANWVENFNGGILYRFFRSFTPLDLLLSF